MGVAIWLLCITWGEWRHIDQPDFLKVRRSEVWYALTATVFLVGVSAYMLLTALRGSPARLSKRAHRRILLALLVSWVLCLVASFTLVSEADTLAPAVQLFLVFCPLCAAYLWDRFRDSNE